MATVTGLTAARMAEIENACIVAGAIDLGTGHLMLTTHGGDVIDAGSAIGPTGPAGPFGGNVGAVDNVIPRSNGTGGTTLQGSIATLSDAGTLGVPMVQLTNAAPTLPYHATRMDYVDAGDKRLKGYTSLVTAVAFNAAGWQNLTAMSITFTAVTGHFYKVTLHCPIQRNGVAGDAFIAVWNGATRLFGYDRAEMVALERDTASIVGIVAGSGSITLTPKAFTTVNGFLAQCASDNPAYFIVEDLGV